MALRQIPALFLLCIACTLCLLSFGCGGPGAAAGSTVLSAASSPAAGADPYAAQVANYRATGIPVAIPRSGTHRELPYVGPVLTRRGMIEPACGVPQLHMPLGGASTARWESGAKRASVPGIPWGNPRPPHTGTARVLFLLSKYNANSQLNTAAAVEDKMFGANSGHTSPSLDAFYNQMSYGALHISGECFPKNGAYLANTGAATDMGKYMEDVLNGYLNDGGSFTDFDGNNDGYIDCLVFVLPDEVRSFVSHFYWDELEPYFGKKIISVCFLGESDLERECNTMHHEMGHTYYLPDYYDYGGDVHPANPGPDGNECMGDGYWELMSAGNWTNPPMPLSPFNKWILGWLTPVVITQDALDLVLHPATDIDQPDQVYLLWRGGSYTEDTDTEYFMLENRWVEAECNGGESSPIPPWKPGKGLLIWHIDEDVWNQRFDMNSDTGGPNSYEELKAADVECADSVARNGYLSGWDDLDGDVVSGSGNPGDANDVFPYQDREFGVDSVPGSTANDGTPTGVRVYNIRKDEGARTVTVDVTVGKPVEPKPTISITEPAEDAVVTGALPVAVEVTGNLSRVDYEIQHSAGVMTASAATAPYSVTMPAGALGNQRVALQATAVGIDGQTDVAFIMLDLYNFPGDTNNDGVISELDLLPISQNIGALLGSPGYRVWYDCDGDGIVTECDAAYIGYHFGDTQP
jgi:M6 family metalloprotease-like protein